MADMKSELVLTYLHTWCRRLECEARNTPGNQVMALTPTVTSLSYGSPIGAMSPVVQVPRAMALHWATELFKRAFIDAEREAMNSLVDFTNDPMRVLGYTPVVVETPVAQVGVSQKPKRKDRSTRPLASIGACRAKKA